MTGFFRVFRYELQRQARRRSFLMITLGVPIIALVIFYGAQLYQQANKDNTDLATSLNTPKKDGSDLTFRANGVVDKSGLLKAPAPFSGLIAYDTEAAAQAALKDNKIGAYYVIAPDYLKTGEIAMYFDRFNIGNLNENNIIQLIISSLATKSATPIDPAVLVRLQSEPKISTHTVNDVGKTDQAASEGAATTLVYVFSMALIFSAFMTSGYLMQSIVEEKETRMIEVLVSSVRPIDLLAGKILSLGLLGLLQMVLWGATATFIVRQAVAISPEMIGLKISNEQLIIVIIYFILGYLLFASIYASIGALSTGLREGPQIAGFLTIPAMLPLYAISLIVEDPNGSLATGFSLFPITAPLGMVMRVAVTEVPVGQLVISIVLLSLTIMFAIWIASRLFRVNTLLAGQMPKLNQIPRLIRESL